MWEQMKQEFSLPLSVPEYVEQMTSLRQALIKQNGIKVIPHVQDFVKRLHEGGLKLAVASSSSLVEIKENLETIGLADYFSRSRQYRRSDTFKTSTRRIFSSS